MLKKEARLNLKKSFKWVRAGVAIENNLVKAHYRFSDKTQAKKVGIATSVKYFKKAAERNRAKRLIAKVLEENFDSLPEGVSLIILPKTGVLQLSSAELTEPLLDIIRKIK